MKRILHIVGIMNKGGTETMLMNLYRKIDRKEIQFDFLSFSHIDGYYDEEIKSLGGRVIKSSKSINDICKIIKDYGPYDVVHAHTLFNSGIAMIAAKKAGIKNRISHAHTTLDDTSSLLRKLYIKSMRFTINHYSTNKLACSKEAGKYLFGENIINKNNYRYFQNLINYEQILYETNDKEVNQFKKDNNIKNDLVLGHIGTFKEAKNQRFLVEILKEMKEKNKNVKLLLIGDGSQRKEIEQLVNKYNLLQDVIFTGTRDDINTLLHSMDVFVFPSIYEGLGLVLLEAQASGLPCVVSEAIQPEADLNIGLMHQLSLKEGAEKWAEKIEEVTDNKKTPNVEEIEKAFEVNGYSTKSCISQLLEVYA